MSGNGMLRRSFLQAGAMAALGAAAPGKLYAAVRGLPFPEYTQYDGLGLAELVRKGDVSAAELLDTAMAIIEARNPAINAVVLNVLHWRRLVDDREAEDHAPPERDPEAPR